MDAGPIEALAGVGEAVVGLAALILSVLLAGREWRLGKRLGDVEKRLARIEGKTGSEPGSRSEPAG